MAHNLGDTLPVCLVRPADVDPAVAGAKGLIRSGQQMGGTRRPRRLAGGKVRSRMPVGLLDRGFHQRGRSEEHTSELQSLMRISYAVFCLKKKTQNKSQPIK